MVLGEWLWEVRHIFVIPCRYLSKYLFHYMERHRRVVLDRIMVCVSRKTGITLTDLRVLSLFTRHQTK
jgi:hypothetical protein